MKTEFLIIDDDDIMVRLHKRILSKAQLTDNPVTFYDGKQAFEHLLVNRGSNQKYLLFLDINMPVMNGWQLLNAIVAHGLEENIAVVIATSSIDREDKMKADSYDCVIGYIEKPLTTANIYDVLGNNITNVVFSPQYLRAS